MLKSVEIAKQSGLRSKITDYNQLIKLRLTFTVVLSAVLGYLIAVQDGIQWVSLFALSFGGFLVVGSANGINQIIEKEFDSKMLRTNNRPLATNRMGVLEASVFCLILGISGVYILGFFLNQLSAYLGLASLISYAFIYTPLKRYSSFAVFIGAFPGAIPPLLGWVACTGAIDIGGLALFAFQFIWQFPHFWAIAWILDEDYKRAGYYLLPSREGRTKKSAILTLFYTVCLIPISVIPYLLGISGLVSMAIIVLAGVALTIQAYRLFRSCEVADAKKLMFYSIVYNPVVLIALFIDKI
ncbi:MAG: protoheme IX farnesyltransferase [Flavobacteriales bacterium]|nr:protoheme IX farnesyltransferase [Flavobacteriales bacterium]